MKFPRGDVNVLLESDVLDPRRVGPGIIVFQPWVGKGPVAIDPHVHEKQGDHAEFKEMRFPIRGRALSPVAPASLSVPYQVNERNE